MSPTSTLRKASFLVSLLAATASTAAQERPFHVEANWGRSAVDEIAGLSIDDSATAFRLGTGYRFLDHLSVDGAYVNLGTIESTVEALSGVAVPVEASADGFEVAVVGRVPVVGALAVTAQAGFLWWTRDSRFGSDADSASGNDVAWGVGVEYQVGAPYALTAGWRRYAVDDIDVDATWLGFMVRFGDAE